MDEEIQPDLPGTQDENEDDVDIGDGEEDEEESADDGVNPDGE